MARNNKPKVRVQPEPLSPEDIKCCACGEVGGKKMVYGIDINPHWAGKPYESFPILPVQLRCLRGMPPRH